MRFLAEPNPYQTTSYNNQKYGGPSESEPAAFQVAKKFSIPFLLIVVAGAICSIGAYLIYKGSWLIPFGVALTIMPLLGLIWAAIHGAI